MYRAKTEDIQSEKKIKALMISPDEELRSLIKEKLISNTDVFEDILEEDSIEAAMQENKITGSADVVFADISPSPESILRLLGRNVSIFKKGVRIVILSNQAQLFHAVESLRIGAFDFIHLPFDEKRWSDFQDRLTGSLAKNIPVTSMPIRQTILKPGGDQGKLLVRLLKREVRLVALQSIVYIEANGAISYLYLDDGERIVSCSQLAHFIELTEKNENMIRVHRKYLVNLDYIQSYNTINGCIQFRVDCEPIYSSRRMGTHLKSRLIKSNNS